MKKLSLVTVLIVGIFMSGAVIAAEPIKKSFSGDSVKSKSTGTTIPAVQQTLVKASGFEVTGGSKPDDTITVKMTIEVSGGGASISIPWKIVCNEHSPDSAATDRSGRQAHTGSSTIAGGSSTTVSATCRALAGSRLFYGQVDPDNTLNEPSGERANNNTQKITKIFADWPKWIEGAKQGIRHGVAKWVNDARMNDVKIAGPIASGGKLSGGILLGRIHGAMADSGAPKPVVDGFMGAVSDAWQKWADSVRVPNLPWYPTFAFFPCPQAPPTPCPPTPLNTLTQDLSSLNAMTLASSIKAKIGDAAEWPGGNAAVDQFCQWFNSGLVGWKNGAKITDVMGSGLVVGCGGVVAGGTVTGWGKDGKISPTPQLP